MQPVIVTHQLGKNYGRVAAVRDLNLTVPAGSICGFLGRNGAGKTTTIKMLMGMVRPSAGRAEVLGRPLERPEESVEIRRRTGFVSETKVLYGFMTVEQLLRFTRGFFPEWRTDLEERYLRLFELPRDRKVETLSKGMRAKLALLAVLPRQAELLMLDEATAGLDPAATEQVLEILVDYVAAVGGTVFFSSHQIAEVEQIADRVAIIDRGRLILEGALDELRRNYRRVHAVFEREAPAEEWRIPGIERLRREGRTVAVLASSNAEAIAARARALGAVSTDVLPVTLKEIFLESVGAQRLPSCGDEAGASVAAVKKGGQ